MVEWFLPGRSPLSEAADRFLEALERHVEGDDRALDSVIPVVYDELKRLAAYHLGKERPDHTLDPTALVHEVYLRLLQQRKVDWKSRAHFIRIAAQQIRRVLVDHARRRNATKRGGDLLRVTLSEQDVPEVREVDLLALNHALDRLDTHSPRDRVIVELKYFGGLTEPEIAAVLQLGERTVRRHWEFARSWLFRELGE